MAQLRRNVPDNFLGKKPPGKQPVAEPASFKAFFLILAMHICKKVLLVNTLLKVGIYMFGTSCLSLVTDLLPIPKCYLADKSNFLNQYFVKLGWGWTLSLLIPFIYYTSSTICCGNKSMVRQHISRLAIATAWWYVCTKTFNWIENATGMCSSTEMEHYNKKICRDAGFEWIGFDVSGHAFLLIHCLLVISEEVRCVDQWGRIAEVIKNEEENPIQRERLTAEEFSTLKFLYKENTPKINIFIAALTVLQLLWELMLISTILYFHNMPQKLLGATFAGLYWLFAYQLWYKAENVMPIPPCKGLIRYMKTS